MRAFFFQCNDKQCGMRFPVAATEPFHHACPRCGATVNVVANVGSETQMPENVASPSILPNSTVHLLLDNWRSLFNVGAAFRSADGAGARHLYLCGITATPESQPRLAKTALGAEHAVAWSYHADAVSLAFQLQQQGCEIWVLERDVSASSLFDITSLPWDRPVVLAAGNEVVGLDPGLMAMADRVIQLPMLGSKQSLNAAVALSVATYWLRAQPVGEPLNAAY